MFGILARALHLYSLVSGFPSIGSEDAMRFAWAPRRGSLWSSLSMKPLLFAAK
jgi:hypothetical protein